MSHGLGRTGLHQNICEDDVYIILYRPELICTTICILFITAWIKTSFGNVKYRKKKKKKKNGRRSEGFKELWSQASSMHWLVQFYILISYTTIIKGAEANFI